MKSVGREVDEVVYSPEPDVQEVTSVQLPQGPLADQHLQSSEREGLLLLQFTYLLLISRIDELDIKMTRWSKRRQADFGKLRLES